MTGWTGEDWNFDRTQTVDGFIYGYAQGRPAVERCELADSRFDVLFYVRDADSSFRAVGMYHNAQFLNEKDPSAKGPFQTAIRSLKKAGIWSARRQAIRKLLGVEEAQRFDSDKPIRWKVRVEDVEVFAPAVPIPHAAIGGPKNHRFGTAYHNGVDLSLVHHEIGSDFGSDPLLETLLGPTFEGRKYASVHYRRERDSAFIRAIKQERTKEGRLLCEECDFDFVEKYGEIGRGYIEAHHRLPLGKGSDDGQETKAEDIALLCANCHAIAHRKLALEAKKAGKM